MRVGLFHCQQLSAWLLHWSCGFEFVLWLLQTCCGFCISVMWLFALVSRHLQLCCEFCVGVFCLSQSYISVTLVCRVLLWLVVVHGPDCCMKHNNLIPNRRSERVQDGQQAECGWMCILFIYTCVCV